MTRAGRVRRVLLMGVFVLTAAIVVEVLTSELLLADTGFRVSRVVASVVSALVTAAYVVGASLIAGSVLLRELGPEERPDDVER